MIDTITVPLDDFDLPGFLDAYRDFYRAWAGDDLDPDASVTVLKRFGDVPMPLHEDRDLISELTEFGWLLFFQLHEPLAGDTALCIDGSRVPSDSFDIGVADGYGFLVEIRVAGCSCIRRCTTPHRGPCRALNCRPTAA